MIINKFVTSECTFFPSVCVGNFAGVDKTCFLHKLENMFLSTPLLGQSDFVNCYYFCSSTSKTMKLLFGIIILKFPGNCRFLYPEPTP